MAHGVAQRPDSPSREPRPGGKPSHDTRWKLVSATLRRHGNRPQALIEGMHAAQESYGCLDAPTLRALADTLGVPLAKVYGVATFYHLFTLQPPGLHTCVVCLGTACHLKGGPELLAAIAQAHDIESGKTSEGGELSLLVARCVGACSLAPVVVIDGETVGRVTPEAVLERVAPWFSNPSGERRT